VSHGSPHGLGSSPAPLDRDLPGMAAGAAGSVEPVSSGRLFRRRSGTGAAGLSRSQLSAPGSSEARRGACRAERVIEFTG